MAFSVQYKRLFSVRILHDYYLKDAEGFYGGSPEEQMQALEAQSYNILNDLEILPTKGCRQLLDGRRMKFKPTPTGFTVWVEVEKVPNTELYRPFISIEAGMELSFQLKAKNPMLNNISNIRMRPNVDAGFYFSNHHPGSGLSFPFLALELPLHDSGRLYEMGEKVKDGNNNIFIAAMDVEGTTSLASGGGEWRPGPDYGYNAVQKYISYQDRSLLPKKFQYFFTPNSGSVDNPAFTLYSMDDVEINRVQATGTFSTGTSYFLDYSGLGNGRYQLEVSDDNGYHERKPVYLHDEYYAPYDWGVVVIKHLEGLDAFRLLESDGYMRVVDFVGNDHTLAPPVFEITIDNRFTYWKYHWHRRNADATVDSPLFEPLSPETFVSVDPLELRHLPALPELGGIKLTAPRDAMIKRINGKNYSEIFLPKLTL